MIGSVLAHIVEGIIRPRPSIERLLAAKPTVADAALMVVAAYALQHAMMLVARGAEATMGLIGHVFSLAGTLLYAFITGILIFAIGRAFGGTATREQSLVAAAWHQLVMTLLWPLLLIGAGQIDFEAGQQQREISLGAFLAVLLFVSQWVWLLARYTATIHGFRSDWGVVGVILGLSMLFSTLFLMVAGA